MCFSTSRVHKLRYWNWDGERIIHDSIVPSSRPPIGRQRGNYDIDVREFLVTERNAVMRRTLEIDLRKYVEKLPGANWSLFNSRQSGAFDHRSHIVAEFVAEKIAYRVTNGLDPWQFPDETLALKSGDCEDRALLIASLLLASGVSSFNVRVALGKFRAWFGKKHQDFDHVWVMYKDESGKWQVIEPARMKKSTTKVMRKNLPDGSEYIPYYLFNDVHLWAVQPPSEYQGKGAMSLKRDWSSLHPEFAGWVHKSILNEALTRDICPPWVLNALNLKFTSVGGQKSLTVDVVDLPSSYDPREHFDNSYIAEGWQLVSQRLAQFNDHSIVNLDAFHRAAHGIGDFYAHTSFGHFGRVVGGELSIYDPSNPSASLPTPPDYSANATFNLASGNFTTNAALWNGTHNEAAALWQGKIISGRYGQNRDSHDLFEMITFIPRVLRNAKDFPQRAALPHHNEIAVDEDTMKKAHVLYSTADYAVQYHRRYDAALRHIRGAFQQNWKP